MHLSFDPVLQTSHVYYRGLNFESSASEGTILTRYNLTMPDSAFQEELGNLSRIHYVGNWYKFVKGPRVRQHAQNGDVRVVAGCGR